MGNKDVPMSATVSSGKSRTCVGLDGADAGACWKETPGNLEWGEETDCTNNLTEQC